MYRDYNNYLHVVKVKENDLEMRLMMPDMSCRTCGSELITYSQCSECKRLLRQICVRCGKKTEERIHLNCFSKYGFSIPTQLTLAQ